jgi:hypothetical protein
VINQALKEKPVTLEVIEGGKQIEPKLSMSGPKGPDWLRELGYGVRFVCQPKHSGSCWLKQFGIAFVVPECILLAQGSGIAIQLDWVDSMKFSMEYKLVAILPEPDTEAGNNEHNQLGPTDSKDNDGHEGPA